MRTLFGVGLLSLVFALVPVARSSGILLEFDRPSGPVCEVGTIEYELGDVPAGTTSRVHVTVRNAGTKRLLVHWDGCDCGVDRRRTHEIAPGTSRRVPLDASSGRRPGRERVVQRILRTNDPERTEIEVVLRMRVTGPTRTDD